MQRSGLTALPLVTMFVCAFAVVRNLPAQETRLEPAPASPPTETASQVARVDPSPASPPSAAGDQVPDAAEPAAAEEQAPTLLDEVQDAIFNGKVSFNLRARAEIATMDGLDTSQAYTERIRLGYGTKPLHGFKFFLEFEDTRSADESLYNAAGLNGEPKKTVIADPESTELNQFLAEYKNEYFGAKAGRQRIILDNARFVGNVGWRQNEQTYDAYTLTSGWVENLNLFYSYVDDVNRIFGPAARRDFKSDSHLLNASYKLQLDDLNLGKISGFAYLLDFSNSAANSSNTYGVRYTGDLAFDEEFGLTGTASYAYQEDAGKNPTNYEADYVNAELSVVGKKLGRVGGGYELLGSDDRTFAFRTPLATLHAFQGWADQFLTTPAAGLEDVYAFVGINLPFGIKSKIVYHWYFSDKGSSEFGQEFDAVASKAFSKNFALLAKLALFDGRNSNLLTTAQASDLQRFWVQAELKF